MVVECFPQKEKEDGNGAGRKFDDVEMETLDKSGKKREKAEKGGNNWNSDES
jgi:hypothetical protein